ncbi:tripartite tricarboxylate transporter substrate binding protein [Falsiroseomonas sp.]|uniref:Bug family tripartite tricarboxylate transporter substrate binding protein n=1 Tax=Falsiroseomonas sp. TaxID=2870721 RepID=UPI00271740C1|nr:tripartite tricarboxylate transporter substrate binding protein [Falsiroseomonas sp.]MDO9498563.1 tripartite tricarboxylate transporter substrate binding protein [Falsiroseomonas sp.]MDP3417783.1 tripartite tricarboxylate transporter substrate binding protein [Falsiroseomonas sp.]
MTIISRRIALGLPLVALAAPALVRPASGQPAWPSRPIRLVVPYAPGGTTDVMARLVAEQIGQRLGQPVIVENRPGAGATIGAAMVAQAEPDGLTLLMSNSGSHGVSPSLYPTLSYDPMRDFTHVALVVTSPSVLVVTKGHPAQDMAQFIAHVRRAGEIDFAVSGVGSSSHLTGVRLGLALGVRVLAVPYRGAGPAMTDTIAGVVPAMMDSLPSAAQHINSGSVRALAVSSATRSNRFPNLPTLQESGVDVVNSAWFGISGPAGLPAPIVTRLAAVIRESLAQPAMITRFEDLTGAPPPESTPESYTEFVRSEIASFAPIVRAAGINPT